MKISISNVGRIKQTSIDLRPLTVIIGPNNSNKTYLAYCIYALWHQAGGGWGSTSRSGWLFAPPTAKQWSIKKRDGLTYEITLDDSFYSYFNTAAMSVAKSLDTKTLRTFFQDTSGHLFGQSKFEIFVSNKDIEPCVEKLTKKELVVAYNERLLSFNCKLEDESLIVTVTANEDILHLSAREQGRLFDDSIREAKVTPSTVRAIVSRQIIRHLFFDALAFPAERISLVTTYKMLQNQRFRYYRDAARRRASSPSRKQATLFEFDDSNDEVKFSQPVEDFLDFLSRADVWPISPSKERSKFHHLANLIERSMQGQNRTLVRAKSENAEIRVEIEKGIEIDLWNASSSIKQLVPLLLYLRNFAESGDFLIIDEPEINLHPLGQVQLLEMLAAMVNLGVKILVTTHSPYIMNHLNNIISGEVDDIECLEKQAKHLYLKQRASFLKNEDVGAYEMRDGELYDLHDEDFGIKWDTLSDVSSELRNIFLDIVDEAEEVAHEKK